MKRFVLFLILSSILKIEAVNFDVSSGTFDEINIVISSDQFKPSNCPSILQSIKDLFKTTSDVLHNELNTRFGKVNLRIPQSWSDDHCYTEAHIRHHQPLKAKSFDVVVGPYDKDGQGRPWTQQSLGCGEKGDFVYLPTTSINKTEAWQVFQQWTRFYHGLFDNSVTSSNVSSGSPQDKFCLGSSPASILRSSLKSFKPSPRFESSPEFYISRETSPKYIIVLENSIAMNFNDSWEVLKAALLKFMLQDLQDQEAQLGVVLFNEAATTKRTVTKLGEKHKRQSFKSSIPFSHLVLSHKTDSCIRCGILRAAEAMQTSGSTTGANIILISQGNIDVLSREDEKEMLEFARKYQFSIFSLPFVQQMSNFSVLFESLSYGTGGNSWIVDTRKKKTDLYMDFVDAFREIQRRTTENGPALVHEHFIEAPGQASDSRGSFVIDQHLGQSTEFNVYSLEENYIIKGIGLTDERQKKYSDVSDNKNFHFHTLYGVPFDSERNVGMTWNYDIDQVMQHQGPQKFAVQVVSTSRSHSESIQVKFYTNFNSHSVHINQTHPLKFFVEVKANSFPVIEARVLLTVKVTKDRTGEIDTFQMQLLDNGNGDPDIKGNDGVYSRYFTHFEVGEGRFDVQIHVDNEQDNAFTYQPAYAKGSNFSTARAMKLHAFSRTVKGDSLRVKSSVQNTTFAPSRILDLYAEVMKDKVQLTWTAPGKVLDSGRVFSYKIFTSELSSSFYKRDRKMLEQIAAKHISGAREQYSISFEKLDFKDSFLAIAAINENKVGSKMAELSNVVHIKIPSEALLKISTDKYTDQDGIKKEPLFNETDAKKKSDKILFYILFGIVMVLLVSIIAVVLILKRFKVKSIHDVDQEDPLEDFDIIDVTDQDAMMGKPTTMDVTVPTFYKSNISILKNAEDSLCNCHEVNNDQDLVINPNIDYSYLNRGIYHARQEPIYMNQQEIANNSIPIYSTVNKMNKNVRIVLENDDPEDDKETETSEEEEEERCLTPSNTYLEVSFEQTPKTTKPFGGQEMVFSSTPNVNPTNAGTPTKVRTITQV